MKRKPFRQRRPYRRDDRRLRWFRLWRRDVESLMRALVEWSLTPTPRITSKMPRNSRWGGVTLWSDEPLTEDEVLYGKPDAIAPTGVIVAANPA